MSDYMVDRIAEDCEDFCSSNIDILGYDRASETLYVEFKSGSTVYAYEGVKESTYDMLVNADSVGSFFAHHIKGNYTSDAVGDGIITLREDDDPIKPEQKWLTTEGDESPFAPGGVLSPSKYGVKWTNGTLTFEPTFEALSEADALAQFNAAVEQVLGADTPVKIVSVTHYFD